MEHFKVCPSSQPKQRNGQKRKVWWLFAAASVCCQQQLDHSLSTCHAYDRGTAVHPVRLLHYYDHHPRYLLSVDNPNEDDNTHHTYTGVNHGAISKDETSHLRRMAQKRLLPSQSRSATRRRARPTRILAEDQSNNSTIHRNGNDQKEDELDRTDEHHDETTSNNDYKELESNVEHENVDEYLIIENSKIFQILFATIVGFIFVFRMLMCGLLFKYRKNGNLLLAQPLVLVTLIAAGSISIVSCIFFTNNYQNETYDVDNIFCLIRDFFILVPLTFSGSILLARVWRIVLLLAPVLMAGKRISHQETEEGLMFWGRCRDLLIHHLTKIADLYYVIEWTSQSVGSGSNKKMKRTSTEFRKIVPLPQLFLLAVILTCPQLLLQILVLTIPVLQKQLVAEDEIIIEGLSAERYVCIAETGNWLFYIAVVLTLIPYVMTAVIAWNSTEELPQVFNEARTYTQWTNVVLLTVAVALPPLIFDSGTNPDTTVYLASILVFSLAMPPCWFLVYPRIWQAVMTFDDNRQTTTRSTIQRLLNQKRSNTNFIPTKNRDDNAKSAKLALTIGKMYEEIGMAQKSIDLFNEALAVWECDPGRERKDKIGGFTMDEINSFTIQDLEHIVSLLIAKGRVSGTFQVAQSDGQKSAAKSWIDALEIYEKAPARAIMKDRSILFPVFSGLFVFLKGEKINQDAKCQFEQNLARKFVRETRLQGDPIHYSRALAMFCEVNARLGKYRIALEYFETLKTIYDPEEHSEGVATAYGTDRSAQAFSQSALWHLQLGNETKALKACEFVLEELMPLMDPKNVLNSCEMLLPIVYVYKTRGQVDRMKILFQKYVVNNHDRHFKEKKSPCEPIFKPVIMLLSICHDPMGIPDFVDVVEWLVREENGVASEFLDSLYTKLCWSMHSLVAELCLRVAKRLIECPGDLSDAQILVMKGLKLSKQADKKMKDSEGVVILPIPYALHEPVFAELQKIATEMGISCSNIFDSLQNSFPHSSTSGSIPCPRNLPSSYLQRGSPINSDALVCPDIGAPTAATDSQNESCVTSKSSSASVGRGSVSTNFNVRSRTGLLMGVGAEQETEVQVVDKSLSGGGDSQQPTTPLPAEGMPREVDASKSRVTFSNCSEWS